MALPMEQGFVPVTKQSTLGEVLEASFTESLNHAETLNILKNYNMSIAEEEGDRISYKELNKMFPDVDVPFNEDMTMEKAGLIAEDARERHERNRIVANGDDSFTTKALSFSSSLAAQAIDPVAIVGGLLTGGFLKHAGITRAISTSLMRSGKTVQGIGVGIAENLAFNVASEAALIVPTQIENQENINLYHNMVNAVVGSVAFPVALGAAGKAFRWVTKLDSPDKVHAANAMQEAKLEAGKRPGFTEDEKLMLEQGIESVDAVRIREQANSPEASMHYDEIAMETNKNIPDELDELDMPSIIAEKMDELEQNSGIDILPDRDIIELKQEREFTQKKVETLDQAIKMAQSCVVGRL